MATDPAGPTARTHDLVLTELGDELLVYDLRRDALHYLKPPAASVWRACDGRRSIRDVAVALGEAPETVEAILVQLADALLLDDSTMPKRGPRASRRALLRGAGIGVVVTSITAPSAAAQVSSTCVPYSNCTQDFWGQTCCDFDGICALHTDSGTYHCFDPRFCDDDLPFICWPE